MKRKITKSELKDYLNRWAVVNAKEIEELRNTSISEKVKQFLALAASMHLFDPCAKKATELKLARKRWQILRRKLQRAK